MEAAIRQLEEAYKSKNTEIDQIERQIATYYPEAAEIVKLYNRLEKAKQRLQTLNETKLILSNAAEVINQATIQYLIPAQRYVKQQWDQVREGKIDEPSIDSGTYEQPQAVNQPVVQLPQKTNRTKTPRKSLLPAESPISKSKQYEYVSKDEYNKANKEIQMHSISEAMFRDIDFFIYEFFKNHHGEVLTQKVIQEAFPKCRTLRQALRGLRLCRRVELDTNLNVKAHCCQ